MRASSSLAIAGILAVLPLHLHASSSLPGDRSSAQRASNSLGFATPTVMSPTRMQRSSTSPVRATYMGLSPRKLNLQIKSAFKRRHLGPTSDEIMEIRSKDAERKLVELRSTTYRPTHILFPLLSWVATRLSGAMFPVERAANVGTDSVVTWVWQVWDSGG